MARIEVVVIAFLALGAVGLAQSSAIAAGKQCKSATTTGTGLTSDQADGNWRSRVKNQYGAAWASLAIAKDVRASQTDWGPASMDFITAYPCRKT